MVVGVLVGVGTFLAKIKMGAFNVKAGDSVEGVVIREAVE